MTRGLVCGAIVAACATVPRAQDRTAPAPSLPPVDRPARLLAVQQLALIAYPELRHAGAQVRVESTSSGVVVTFGFASRDRNDILALSRPREAALVIEATFDTHEAIAQARLRGQLAHSGERRAARAMAEDVENALTNDGAAFPPSKRALFLQQLDLRGFTRITGLLTPSTATFQSGSGDEGMYWEVPATSALGEAVTLRFEPYAGRLVSVVRGGGQ